MQEFLNTFLQMKWYDVLLLIFLPFILITSLRGLVRGYKKFKSLKKEIKELEENKCKGPHDWIDMNIMGKKTHVCKTCCFVPDFNAFAKRMYVNGELKARQFQSELEEYRKVKIKEMSENFSLEPDVIEDIANSVFSIKKDFTTKFLAKEIEKMKVDNE